MQTLAPAEVAAHEAMQLRDTFGVSLQGRTCSPLAAQSSLPGERCTSHMGLGQMVKARGIMALIRVKQGLKCENTA